MTPTLIRIGAALVLIAIAGAMFGPALLREGQRSHRRIVRKALRASPTFWHIDAEGAAWRGWGLSMLGFAALFAVVDLMSEGGRAGEPLRTLLSVPLYICLLGFLYVGVVFVSVRLNRDARRDRRRP